MTTDARASSTAVTEPLTEPTFAVVICAYTVDRWPLLLAAVASVRDQLLAGDRLLVVVDHNPELLHRLRAELAPGPDLVVLPNTEARGLSGARNTGVRASTHTVVGFLDDDAVARPGWLATLREAFAADDSVTVVGTTVEPRWEGGRPPRWFPAEFGWVVGCGYRGLPVARTPIRNPIGASMAVRRSAFALAGEFSEVVGRVGALPVGCEETEFCIRVARTVPDAVVLHEPGSAVDHVVPRARQTLRYFVRRCFHEGRSKWAVTRLGGSRAGLSAERRYLRVVLPSAVARGVATAVRRGDVHALVRSAVVLLGLSVTVTGFGAAAIGSRGRPVHPPAPTRLSTRSDGPPEGATGRRG